MANSKIYLMRPSTIDDDPWLDFSPGVNTVPWLTYGGAIRGEFKLKKGTPPIRLHVDHKDALIWDQYFGGAHAVYGPYSQRFIDLVEPLLKQHFAEPYKIYINDQPYYYLNPTSSVDCLDRERSDIFFNPDEPDEILAVDHFVIHADKVKDPLIFVVPETRGDILVTESVKQRIEHARLNGFEFVETQQSPE